ncbi:MAG: hypothetical protein PHI98_09635 [Eubacteriales bacterium]|nr:hypothetical protein [Eubacteriales bacterium]
MARKKQEINVILTCCGYKYPSSEFFSAVAPTMRNFNRYLLDKTAEHMHVTQEGYEECLEALDGKAPWGMTEEERVAALARVQR